MLVQDRILGDEGRRLSIELEQLFREWKPIRDRVLQHMKAGEREQAAGITREQGAEHVRLLTVKMTSVVNYARESADGFYQSAEDTAARSFKLSVALTSFSIIVGALVAFLLSRSYVQRISLFRNAITHIQQNADLTKK